MPNVSSPSRDRRATPVASDGTHLLVSDPAGGAPYGVVAAIHLVDLVTRP